MGTVDNVTDLKAQQWRRRVYAVSSMALRVMNVFMAFYAGMLVGVVTFTASNSNRVVHATMKALEVQNIMVSEDGALLGGVVFCFIVWFMWYTEFPNWGAGKVRDG